MTKKQVVVIDLQDFKDIVGMINQIPTMQGRPILNLIDAKATVNDVEVNDVEVNESVPADPPKVGTKKQ